MTEKEKEVLAECFQDTVKCSTNLIYESLALLFETMALHPELSLQQVLAAMSMAMKKLAEGTK